MSHIGEADLTFLFRIGDEHLRNLLLHLKHRRDFCPSKRTDSMWTRTTLFDGATAVAEVLLHQGVFKASYPGYPADAA